MDKCVLCGDEIKNPKKPKYKGKSICQNCFDLTKDTRSDEC